MSRYEVDPSDELRRRYRDALDFAVAEADDALGDAGRRNTYRMHLTLSQIGEELAGVDYTGDGRSARVLARIRARLDAYNATKEGGR